ncbi:hypothetical protein SAMN05444166_8192 [Singulisphaera sp. GP187]|nr:hypothetical protein [Singulisphaera sp. GP187]SIO66713.1 hypothetical protein SAMN05444166_8192 [Singulisphaera sp. GP187]
MKRTIAIITTVVIVLGLLFAWRGMLTIEILGTLAFGWLTYSARVLPRVTIGWDGAATGVICLILFMIGLHLTLRWFSGEVQKARGATVEGHRPWSLWWTTSLVALIVMMFIVGLSATGVVHQAGWLIASRRSLLEVKPRLQDDWGTSADYLRLTGMGLIMLVDDDRESVLAGEPRPNAERIQSWMTVLLSGTNFTLGGPLHVERPWNDPQNSAYFKGVVPYYLNPEIRAFRSAEGYALSHYAGNVHVLSNDRALRSIARENAANTIIAGEIAEGFKPWGDPANLRDPGAWCEPGPGRVRRAVRIGRELLVHGWIGPVPFGHDTPFSAPTIERADTGLVKMASKR